MRKNRHEVMAVAALVAVDVNEATVVPMVEFGGVWSQESNFICGVDLFTFIFLCRNYMNSLPSVIFAKIMLQYSLLLSISRKLHPLQLRSAVLLLVFLQLLKFQLEKCVWCIFR